MKLPRIKLPHINAKAKLGLVALALIGWGAWQIYQPAAPILVGALIWLDLATDKTVRRK